MTESIAVVPNADWSEELNKQILARDQKTILGKKVYTLNEFVTEHSNYKGVTISRSLQKHLIRSLLKKTKTSYFKTASSGVVNLFYDTISKLKQNLITPDKLKNILKTRGDKREYDLLNLYTAYEEELNKLSLFDNEYLYEQTPKISQYKSILVCGFDPVPPFIKEKLLNLKIVSTPAAKDIKPVVTPFPSPFAEAKFAARTISNALLKKTDPSKIAIYLPKGSQFAWEIVRECANLGLIEKEIVYSNRNISNIAAKIFNNISLPESGTPEEYCRHLLPMLETEYKKLSTDSFDRISARTFWHIDQLAQNIKKLSFEFSIANWTKNISKLEFLNLLNEELTQQSAWPEEIPFRFLSFESAGAYNNDVTIVPCANDGSLPQTLPHMRFFSDLDTLSPEPDLTINTLFPTQEEAIKRSLNNLRLSYSKETFISYHNFNADGKEAYPSPFIVKYNLEKTATNPISLKPKKETCGSNLNRATVSALKEQMENHIFSATQLEEFGKCPFAYFCRYILGIEPPDEITPEILAKDKGTLIHESLEQFFITYRDIYINSLSNSELKPKWRSHIADIVNAAFDNNKELLKENNLDLIDHLRIRTITLLTSVLESEWGYLKNVPQRPAHFEMAFNETLVEDIKIRGFIDRVDLDDSTFTVIDYKTGAIGNVETNIRKGIHLQLPIYTEIAKRKLNKEPSGAFLYSIREQRRKNGLVRGEFKAHSIGKNKPVRYTFDEEKWEELISLGIQKAREHVEKIRNGCFEGEPEKCESYCNWKDVCRRG